MTSLLSGETGAGGAERVMTYEEACLRCAAAWVKEKATAFGQMIDQKIPVLSKVAAAIYDRFFKPGELGENDLRVAPLAIVAEAQERESSLDRWFRDLQIAIVRSRIPDMMERLAEYAARHIENPLIGAAIELDMIFTGGCLLAQPVYARMEFVTYSLAAHRALRRIQGGTKPWDL